jgi:hypothetical protein
MSRKLFISLLAFGLLINLNGQERVTVSGYIRDAASGEDLIGANVAILETGRGTITNEYGFYSLTLPPGFYTLVYSYVGYAQVSKPVRVGIDMEINTNLVEESQELEAVTITARAANDNITRVETGSTKLQMNKIRKIPALLGEVDVIKAIQLLPGVQFTSEGSSGFSVRGGSPDQNLILLDEATVYNASHLLGFFSVFNNDAIKDVKLYKGDIPASAGGRLSSLLDVRMKDGNNQKFTATGGIGTISSRLTLEGPLFSEKGSFLLAGRRSYADIFLPLARDTAIRDNSLFFYDLNAKLNYTFNENNRLYVSGYMGRDVFSNDFAGFEFGNRTVTVRWNHLFSKKLFSNFSFIYSKYVYDLGTPKDEVPSFNWFSDLEDFAGKADFIYYLSPEHTFRFGASSVYHIISPGTITTVGEDESDNQTELPLNYALESGAYLSGESKIGDVLSVRYGVRYSLFNNIGEGTIYNFDEDFNVVDSTVYSRGEFFNSNMGLEPRLAFNFVLNEKNSLKASYSRTFQYLQKASNSSAGTPLDIWFPASPNVLPQRSDQISAGYFRNFLENRLETSMELYYKNMKNSIDFVDHAQLLLNPRLEGEIRRGEAQAYGLELFARYTGEQFSGWISYTYSNTTRHFDEPGNLINEGRPYVAPYDKPHDISLVANYDITRRMSVGANWVYSTGLPFTLPTGRYEIDGNIVPVYTGRNEYRLPDYHRLDLSYTIRGKDRADRRWKGEWNFSIYNAYARKNVWTLNFEQDGDDPNRTYAEMTYLFSIVPAITYNFTF